MLFLILIIAAQSFETENIIKEEIQKIFFGLPIHRDVKTILNESKLDFQYSKYRLPLTKGEFTESWQTLLTEYKYLTNYYGQVIMQINKEKIEEKKCHDLNLRLNYTSIELLQMDYNVLIERFISKGAFFEETTYPGSPILFKSALLDLGDEDKEITFTLSMISYDTNHQLVISYQMCRW